MIRSTWSPGSRLTHRFNPELGPGLVEAVEGRTLVVRFPNTDTRLRLAADSDALEPLRFDSGTRAVLLDGDEPVVVEGEVTTGRIRLTDGREVDPRDLWPATVGDSLGERLAVGDIDSGASFVMRLEAMHLASIREVDGLGSFLGGRIHLLPHQLYAAQRATRTDPSRWLLADEVGLGKTVEACLILSHLIRTGRAERALVVAPDTLTVQWLGELWRKYHQVFVLLDEKRLSDVDREFGRGFNPFQVYRHVVVGLDFLSERRRLVEQAVETDIDLVIVDEAHHLRRPLGHAGNQAYRAILPLAALGHHLLLLTATPLEEDALGFFRLLELLRPEEFGTLTVEDRVRRPEPLPPCTSSARRRDIPGLPERRPVVVDLSGHDGWGARDQLEQALRETAPTNPVARRDALRKLRRALASGRALAELLGRGDNALKTIASDADLSDPRLEWLGHMAPRWKRDGEKTLVFVAHRATLKVVQAAMGRLSQLRVGVFHEDLSTTQRDMEVAQFRHPDGPSMLVSTECGGEGRNFQFCTRLVLFDLPWNPVVVEQRIGRLDRIERHAPVEIRYFRPRSKLANTVVDVYERLGVFREPLGLVGELTRVESALESVALAPARRFTIAVDRVLEDTQVALGRVRKAALHELHRDPYGPDMAPDILARIPADLEQFTKRVVLATAEQLDLDVEEHRHGRRYSIELGHRSRVESLPGVRPGSSFLGTFDREEAVLDESIDFFSSGHPLVEGILAHVDESALGRVALLRVVEDQQAFGLLALYRATNGFTAVAVDIEGQERPDWAARLIRPPLETRRVKPDTWTRQPGWLSLIRRLAAPLEARGRPLAMAAFKFEKRRALQAKGPDQPVV